MSDTDLNVDDQQDVDDQKIIDDSQLPADDVDDENKVIDDKPSDDDEQEFYDTEKDYLTAQGLKYESMEELIAAHKEQSTPVVDPRVAQLDTLLAQHGGIAGVIAMNGFPSNQTTTPAPQYTPQYQPQQLQQQTQQAQNSMTLQDKPASSAIEQMIGASNWDDNTKAVLRSLGPALDGAMSHNANVLLTQNSALYQGLVDLQGKTNQHEYQFLPRKIREAGKDTYIPRPVLDNLIARENQAGRLCTYEQAVNMFAVGNPAFNTAQTTTQPQTPGPQGQITRPIRKARLKKTRGKSIESIRAGIINGTIDSETLDVETLRKVHAG